LLAGTTGVSLGLACASSVRSIARRWLALHATRAAQTINPSIAESCRAPQHRTVRCRKRRTGRGAEPLRGSVDPPSLQLLDDGQRHPEREARERCSLPARKRAVEMTREHRRLKRGGRSTAR
jgi:hypothetical protein